MELDALFIRLGGLPRTEAIQAAEEAWIGGIADFGDRRAGVLVQAMPGYFDYRGAIEDALREALGDRFTVYRAMPEDQIGMWEARKPRGPLAVTLDPDVAHGFRRFAAHEGADLLAIVEMDVSPEHVLMVGKPEEAELVIDADALGSVCVRRLTRPPAPL